MTNQKIGKTKSGGYFVFTSNVDGQFQEAGYRGDRIVECHGSIHYFQCLNNCSDEVYYADPDDIEVEIDEELFEAREPLPKCENCGSVARPNILMFNDADYNSNRGNQQSKRLEAWLGTTRDSGLTIIELGAGTVIPTVRDFSEDLARRDKVTLIRINQHEYNVPNGQISINLGAKEAINRIYQLLE